MTVKIEKSIANGVVEAPPSKSVAHRALICGSLSGGSEIRNLAYSKDIQATIDCLEKMGACVKEDGNSVRVGGLNVEKAKENVEVFCNESGSTLRFLIPLAMFLGKKITFCGSQRLFERPLGVYEDICKKQGVLFEKKHDRVTVFGKLKSGEYSIPGDISSQFITGLLFVLPLLESDSILTVTGKFESASYIDLTLNTMRSFGVEISRRDNVFFIKGGQSYTSQNYTVEGDCSNAAFLEAFNLLGGNVEVKGINPDTLQGDRVYKSYFGFLKNNGKTFDLSDCPDLAPVMFAMAAYKGGAEFTGTARLKIKESDRAEAMAEELAKFGIEVSVFDDSVTVHKGRVKTPAELLQGHNDHRIVMALSLLCSVTGGTIEGAESVSKSYPDYFEKIESMGIMVKIQ
ncbi:MAG: 3-phosphoshikimate 1-carboxyvinyltransferase [Clostridia bacterium]|nr:3-phosphoshikimate 1-carboxyvinyltransferase [Clostridia bacterium]